MSNAVLADAMPTLLALDFDGVLCDGMIEYFQTAWRGYCRIWSPEDKTPPAGLAESFYRTRPVVETGWEMPLIVRSLLQGISEAEILADWGTLAKQQIEREGLNPADLSAAVDGSRDEWIAADLDTWLAQHRFYPGVVERVAQALQSGLDVYIISTKESRFIRQLLAQRGVDFPGDRLIGKEIRQPKAQTLRDLIQQHTQDGTPPAVWFVEDRLKTLQTIQPQPDLATVRLFLADWGYNTAAERDTAQQDPQIHLISLAQFAGAFPGWLPA
ncbi:HAD family hydrolase [Thermoleptolyngbya sp. M55_K2018_002]|uniref:HAD family hydrolase n=1 Tax=Thermoleptolyngbya sp. M55_K2018_002 TaxID=2747808 RepID=UPI001A0076D4|nr:HAD family hydrolase [Thermoleptolyngbya sp. M55_K2018_002]HIK41341.1 HAD family hydrolase [Thermoleptolyngbya sp. M55_K2018_002]